MRGKLGGADKLRQQWVNPKAPEKIMPPDQVPGEPVFNQSPPFADVNLFTSDMALREAVAREGAAEASDNLETFGRLTGGAAAGELARLANEHAPRLRDFDAGGGRLDRVEFHPAYHRLMGFSTSQGLHCSTWDHLGTAARHDPVPMSLAAPGATWPRRWKLAIAARSP